MTRASRPAIVLAVASVLGMVVLGAPASASQLTDAERTVAELGRAVEVAAEDYNAGRVRLEQLRAQADAAHARADSQAVVLASLEAEMAMLAVETFKRGGVDRTVAVLFSASPAGTLQGLAALDSLAGRQRASAADLRRVQRSVEADRAALDARLTEVGRAEAELAVQKADIESRLAAAEAELAAVRLAEEARATERARSDEVASRAADLGRSAAGPSVPGSGSAPPAGQEAAACARVQAPDSRVATVLAFACAQLGKPYRWGASGPDSYDCSGFTSAAWAAAGVALPHSSRAQHDSGVAVDRSEMQPGDLIYSYSPISHVGIYLGDGLMIHSPNTGDAVKISSFGNRPYAGATRPGA